jgi:hypothetical protein
MLELRAIAVGVTLATSHFRHGVCPAVQAGGGSEAPRGIASTEHPAARPYEQRFQAYVAVPDGYAARVV